MGLMDYKQEDAMITFYVLEKFLGYKVKNKLEENKTR